jgi:UDP-N-acetyl-D-galactosamine dehydrogenase
LRNTRVVDIVAELQDYNCTVDVYDPWVTVAAAGHEYGITPLTRPEPGTYDGVVLAVAHDQFKAMGVEAIRTLGKKNHVLYDLKYLFPADATDLRL